MTIYQRSKSPRPDSDFEAGALVHIAPGKSGRLLDGRRTPVRIVSVDEASATFAIRIEAFEDQGAIWEVALENACHYQFEPGPPTASAAAIDAYTNAIARLDRTEAIACDAAVRVRTHERIENVQREARAWLEVHGHPAAALRLPGPATRQGVPELYQDLEGWMRVRGLEDIEDRFARQFVSNPYSGDLVKAHRMVIAELGLVPYQGKVLRHSDAFAAAWSRERRAAHVIARLAFVREALARLNVNDLQLYRGLSTDRPLRPTSNETFVSSTLSFEVAMSHFRALDGATTRALFAQSVALARVFMTYLETRAMNAHYQEAEAVLLFDPDNAAF